MKINGRCRVCNRDFPVDVVLSSTAGHCPFCGTPLDPHYGAMLVPALAELQRAGTHLEQALEQLGGMGPNLELDLSSVLQPIQAAIAHRGERARA